MISRNSIIDAVKIADRINKTSFSKQYINQDDNWKEIIQPLLNVYEEKYKMFPKQILEDLLTDYLLFNQHRLVMNFKIHKHNSPFSKNALFAYCWSCIYLKNNHPNEEYKCSPQLVVSITNVGINCAFSFGAQIDDGIEAVNIFRDNLEMKRFVKENYSDCFLYDRKRKYDDMIVLSELSDDELFSKWNKDYQITIPIHKKDITKEIKKQIITALDRLVLLYIESVNLM